MLWIIGGFVACAAVTVILYLFDKKEHEEKVRRMAKEKTNEEIDTLIQRDADFLKATKVRGLMEESVLENLDFWKEVKRYKNRDKVLNS